MRVMLTGATGLTGFHTAVALLRAGHELRCLVRSEEKLRRAFEGTRFALPEFVVGDMTDASAVELALEGCDAAIHTAALVSLDVRRGEEIVASNLRGTELVVGGAVKRGLEHIVYVSSLAAILDPISGEAPTEGPLAKSLSSYSASKVRCEEFVRDLQEQGHSISMVYPSGIQAPQDPGLSEANRGLMQMLQGGFIPVTSGGYLFVDARDLGDALAALLDARRSGRFIASGHFLPWAEYRDVLQVASGRPMRGVPVAGWLLRLVGRSADALRKRVPFESYLSLEAMMFATRLGPLQNAAVFEELGVYFHDPYQSIQETIRWLFERGHLAAQDAPAMLASPQQPAWMARPASSRNQTAAPIRS